MYRSLDSIKISATIDKLTRRVGERFPETGLEKVAQELSTIAHQTSRSVRAIARPNSVMRFIVAVVLLLGLVLIGSLIETALHLSATRELTSVLQGLDSALSIILVFGGGAFYLSTLEGRWRRDKALEGLHELRSIVHVIDMHQLTKDPSALGAPKTSSSPDRSMTPIELLRYLGYCAELLSLASKLAALYADKIRDPVIVDAVGDIERLSSNLSAKVWQKIQLIQTQNAHQASADRKFSGLMA